MPPRQKHSTDDDEGDDDSGHQQPAGIHLDESLIQRCTLIAEADTLSRIGNYAQAIPLYSAAITMKTNEALLLCRARCRIFTGDILGALSDSDAALKLNENSLKATLCKADVLFTKGDFEMALVWYHRGLHQKPEHEDFKSGVNRCKEAIKNAINELDEEQLAALKKDTQRLRDMMHTESHRDDADRHQSISLKQTTTVKKSGSKSVLNKRGGVYRSNNSVHNSTSGLVTDRDQMEKNLLEEIYPDRMFLKELMNDPIMMSASDGEVGSLIRDGFVFLDQRIEFWQSRNPLAVHEVTHLA